MTLKCKYAPNKLVMKQVEKQVPRKVSGWWIGGRRNEVIVLPCTTLVGERAGVSKRDRYNEDVVNSFKEKRTQKQLTAWVDILQVGAEIDCLIYVWLRENMFFEVFPTPLDVMVWLLYFCPRCMCCACDIDTPTELTHSLDRLSF